VKFTTTPTSAEVKNEWSYTSTPPIRFQGVENYNLSWFREEVDLHTDKHLTLGTNIRD
jgi:hypothetical protein